MQRDFPLLAGPTVIRVQTPIHEWRKVYCYQLRRKRQLLWNRWFCGS